MTTVSPEMRSPWSRRVVVYPLLALIVLIGGYFRFVGLNWDDFAASHPDERFLTMNLLPLVGGGLEFTRDTNNFPDLNLVILTGDLRYSTRVDVQVDPTAVLGAVEGTKGVDFAHYFLGVERMRVYSTMEAALTELVSGQIAAIVADSSQSLISPVTNGGTSVVLGETILSEEFQRVRCLALNPDRFGVGSYFDARCSNLNPHNSGAGFFAYGTLPLLMAHLGVQAQNVLYPSFPDLLSYQGTSIVWRFLSIIFIFFTGARLHNRWTGLLAALLYAAAPLAIQKAHFGTVNAITAFFVAMAFWAAVGVQERGRLFYYGVFGIAFGCALSGRINLFPLVGVLWLGMIVHTLPVLDRKLASTERLRLLSGAVGGMILAMLVAGLTFRLANPYAFTGPGFFGITPNSRFFEDLSSATFGVSGKSDAPPNYQWVGRMEYVYPLKDIVLWGMGIAPALMAFFGWGWAGWQVVARRVGSTKNLFLFAWVLVYFGYMGKQWVMTMRYYLPLYAALALLGGWAIVELYRESQRRQVHVTRVLLGLLGGGLSLIPLYYLVNGLLLTLTASVAGVSGVLLIGGAFLLDSQRRALLLGSFVGLFALVWAGMFTNIYRHELTRVAASRWIFENIPGDFAMTIEGAPQGTPLVNIGLGNASGDSANTGDEVYRNATRLFAAQPQLVNFVAPATGRITEVIAPHIGDLDGNFDEKTLYVSLAQADERGDMQLLGEATVEGVFDRTRYALGDSYTIQLSQPVDVVEGQTYTFKVEATAGNLVTGNVMVTEGDWDDRITTIMVCQLPEGITLTDDPTPGTVGYNQCNGMRSAYGLLNSFDIALSYPIDDLQKRESMRNGLHNGDYFTITSNRFYDSELRNNFRFPLTNKFYEELFAERLGYELIQVFNNSYALAGLEVADQALPIYGSPEWFNEFEPDEAFHVYDHPVTFIFKKRMDYDNAKIDAFLDSYPLNQSIAYDGVTEAGGQILGVAYWDSLQIDAAPNGLMQSRDQRQINQEGGTWSEKFDSNSLLNTNQVVGVGVWWLAISVYGWLAFPILFSIFPKLADRGFGVARIVGLFVVGYVAWAFASVKVPMWSQAGILLSMMALTLLGLVVAWRRRDELRTWLRTHWKMVISIEAMALVLFLIMIFVRLTNPDIWHHPKGGEKPMDFAMFNATLRATTFPAADVWFAGGNLNYYYWGYVLFGSPVLLLKIVPAFAYNLIIPTIFMVTGLGAFSAAFNIANYWRGRQEERGESRRLVSPVLAGVTALILCIFLGNLDTIRVFGNGVAILGGYQQPQGLESWLLQQEGFPEDGQTIVDIQQRATKNYLTDRVAYEVNNSLTLISGLVNGISRLAQGDPLPLGTDRWYWGPSRVLTETPGVEGGAITEMPAFTFIYGDLHAHMMNMPVLLFVILFLFSEVTHAQRDERTFFELILALVLGAAMVGMIQAINTWDWPAFLLFGVIALGYAWWVRFEGFSRQSLTFLFFSVGGFLTLSFAASLPYRTWYAATYGSVSMWTGGKTPFWAYFDLWGLFLFLIVSLLLLETMRWLRSVKVKEVRGYSTFFLFGTAAIVLMFGLMIGAAALEYQVALIVVPLIVWIGFLFFRPQQHVAMQFVLVCIGLALAMTLGVEVIVLGGDVGRQNTVFKFYMQAWMLISVAGGVAFAVVFASSSRWSAWLEGVWYVPLFVLVFIAALFPIMATRARSYDRLDPNLPLTLNGLDYLRSSTIPMMYTVGVLEGEDDYQIIRWMQENVQGTPYIMEGREPASEYTWTARVGINTGLPTVLGWRFHQTQQRTFAGLGDWINQREANVNVFYDTEDVETAESILRFYDVEYVIWGGLERATTIPEGVAKFQEMIESGVLGVVYEQGESRIYRVNQAALDPLN